MKKLLSMILAAALVMSMAGCDNSFSGSDTSSSGDNSSSLSESSMPDTDTSSRAQTTTTTSAATTTSTTTSQTTKSTAATAAPAPLPATAKDLIKITKELYGTQEIVAESKNMDDAFESYFTSAEGKHSASGRLKTIDIFSPFDDLLTHIDYISLAKDSASIFMIGNSVRFKNTGSDAAKEETVIDMDGAVMAIVFNCDDASQAEKVYKAVMNQDLENDLEGAKKEGMIVEKTADHVMVATPGREMYMCYYLSGSDVIVLAMYDMGLQGQTPVGPYTKQYDYKAEADKLAKALGVKLPSTLK
ncbi:MAG: hypothetical protein II703_04365 [Ruminococcus sp.]|nr:hypothetical protein [Ruminococcus sp.]